MNQIFSDEGVKDTTSFLFEYAVLPIAIEA